MKLFFKISILSFAIPTMALIPSKDDRVPLNAKVIESRQLPVATFDCTSMPEVCNNMCWGYHCSNFPRTLTLDRTRSAARRRTAGCTVSKTRANPSGRNRCRAPGQAFGTKPNGQPSHNCDEFPFASTAEADAGGQINRCVPEEHNSAQGQTLKSFYQGRNNGDQFTLAFGTPTAQGVQYCVNPPGGNVCVNDGNIFIGVQGPAPDPAAFVPKRSLGVGTPMYRYRTKLGREVSSPSLFASGHSLHVYSMANNGTSTDEVELEMDEVLELLV